MSTYTVSVLINGNASGYRRATQDGERSTRSFVAFAQREFGKLRQFATSAHGQLAGLGASVGFMQMQRNAAQLEKTLTQVRLTAGMSAREQTEAYERMFAMVKRNGGVIEETVTGFNSLVQAGLSYKEAIASTEGISMARAVTGANDAVVANALTVGAANFGFDLSKAGAAVEMLDKMTASGRMGNAELENLSSILPRVASGAQRAGMDFDKTLAFLQGLSMVEKQPERLATLADSTLRLFTNMRYAKDAQKALGINMFDKQGGRRDPIAVLEDIRTKYSKLTTDAQRFKFMGIAFGQTDLDTQRGLSALLSGDMLGKVREFETATRGAGGTLHRDIATATDNASDQASRLKNTLRLAAEGFAKPLNDAFARGTRFMLDSKQQGGLDLSGGQIAAGGAMGLAGLYAASRFLPPLMRGIAGRLGGVGAGVATGKALEAAAGVTPVYVTNWSEISGGSGVGLVGAGAGAATAGKLSAASLLPLVTAGLPLAALLGSGLYLNHRLTTTDGLKGRLDSRNERVSDLDQLLKLEREGGGSAASIARLSAERQSMVAERDRIAEQYFGDRTEMQRLLASSAARGAASEVVIRVESADGLKVQTQAKPAGGTMLTLDNGRTNRAAGY